MNGIIYADAYKKPAQYLAISGNRVLAAGRGTGALWRGRNTEEIDLHGMCVTPGIIDSHIHFLDYALSLDRVNLEACPSESAIFSVLEERSKHASPGEWILGRGWGTKQFGGFPHKRLLDRIFPKQPVVLNSHDEHSLWLNSMALEIAGITGETSVPGGHIGIDPDGTPNGIVGENAIMLVRPHITKPDSALRQNSLLHAQSKLHSMGIVGIHNVDANQAFGDLQDLLAGSKLRLRVFHSIPIRQLEEAVRIGLRSGLGNEWFQFGFVKIFSDGALGSQTALMLDPYNEVGGAGIETIPEPDLREKIALALQNGIAVAVHAIGDRANRQVLNAFEQNKHLLQIPKAKSRIEHVQLLHPEDIPRFAGIGVIASMQPYHAISDYELAQRYWGGRARYAYAWRSLLRAGAKLSFGSDAPVEEPHPVLDLKAAVARWNWDDTSETISAADALYAYTTAPAIVSGDFTVRGSLESGKIADFTVFSENPLNANFSGVTITATAIDGEFVYRDSL